LVPLTSAANTLTVAVIQLSVTEDKGENIRQAQRLLTLAADRGAQLAVLPEKWNGFGTHQVLRACAEPIEDGASALALRSLAARHRMAIVGGSITELEPTTGKLWNTSLAINDRGEIVAIYRKIHMFDVEIAGEVYAESETEEAGEEIVVAELAGWMVGLSICYDLRFPELYRILVLRGAELLVVPAAFTMLTGRDHWELLLRARAVENQCFVVAANEFGQHGDGRRTYGRSLVADPWGTVVAQASDGEAVVLARLDRQILARIRASLPSLANRRASAYRWPDAVML